MEVYERIKNRRKELGLSADNVADALGVSRATLYRYESADIEKLPTTILEPLSRVLHCSPAYLMGWSDKVGYELPDKANEVTLSEFEHIKKYRNLDPHGKKMVDFTLNEEWERSTLLKPAAISSVHNASTRLISYYYRLASAGTGQIIFDMPPTKRIETILKLTKDEAAAIFFTNIVA